jgi:hypothetical protein
MMILLAMSWTSGCALHERGSESGFPDFRRQTNTATALGRIRAVAALLLAVASGGRAAEGTEGGRIDRGKSGVASCLVGHWRSTAMTSDDQR